MIFLLKMRKRTTKVLAIETSCDETSLALVECRGPLSSPKFKVLKNIVSSQIPVHRPFGGVVPNLAKREHLKNLPVLLRQILKPKASSVQRQVNCVAVTVGPGLEPALWTGINFAQELAAKWNKPLIGVNHMEGHLFSCWLPKSHVSRVPRPVKIKKLGILNTNRYTLNAQIKFPAIALVVSGGHTILLQMTSITKWKVLGETLDDAAGEAFDKVARMLGLPYPGGPEIDKLAKRGDPNAIKFPRPMLNKKNYEFSFSGLKTAVLYHIRDLNAKRLTLNAKANIAASFQAAVIDVLVQKTVRAAQEFKAKSILLCGGVSANKKLREELNAKSYTLNAKFIVPDYEFNTDNAAMIAAAAYIDILQKNEKKLPLSANGNLTL